MGISTAANLCAHVVPGNCENITNKAPGQGQSLGWKYDSDNLSLFLNNTCMVMIQLAFQTLATGNWGIYNLFLQPWHCGMSSRWACRHVIKKIGCHDGSIELLDLSNSDVFIKDNHHTTCSNHKRGINNDLFEWNWTASKKALDCHPARRCGNKWPCKWLVTKIQPLVVVKGGNVHS